jgi:excisionase family DNA binding protein
MSKVPVGRICYAVRETAALLGVGKNLIYREISGGRLRVAKMGKRTLVPADAIREWLDAACAPQNDVDPARL